MTLCRQQTPLLCPDEAEWPCIACGKPVCRAHRYFSEMGDRQHGLLVWHHLCATCFALEQHTGKPAGKCSRVDRVAFFESAKGEAFVGQWELDHLDGQTPGKGNSR